jgi:hypothetical protein
MPRREITDGIERDRAAGKRIRKIYRPGVLLDSGTSKHLREIERMGAGIRITPDELNETIILDRRVAILAGDMAEGVRAYSVITSPEVVQGFAVRGGLARAADRAGLLRRAARGNPDAHRSWNCSQLQRRNRR